MTKKELRNLRYLDAELVSIRDQINMLSAQAEGLSTVQLSDMPKGGCGRGVDDYIADVIDLQATYAERLAELNRCRKRAESAIELIDRVEYRAVLRLRYLSGKSWEEVADQMGYSLRGIFKIHGAALVELEKCAVKCSKVQ